MINKVEIKEGERVDDLEIKNYCIIQNTKKYCFDMDAVLLANFAKGKRGEQVIDLGTGTGIIPMLMEAKTSALHFTALEIQKESVEMAKRSVLMNGQESKIDIVEGDIKEASKMFGLAKFNVVTTNPPYMKNEKGLVNPDMSKAIARHEIMCNLEDVIRESSKLLKVTGRMYMVHRPFRLVEIINTLTKYKLEPKRIRFVHPYADKEPKSVLIEAVKGGKPMLKVEKPLVVYKDVNMYTDEIYEIYGKTKD